MAYEDLTTYTEVDPNSHLAETTTRVTYAGLLRNEDCYLYYDKGANFYSGDFTHLFDVKITASDDLGGVMIWALTNILDDWMGIFTASGDELSVMLYREGADYQIRLYELDGGSYYSDTYSISVNTAYYLSIVRNEAVGTYGTLYCYIYSDAARTTLLTTLSITLRTSKKDYRYILLSQSSNSGAAGVTQSGYGENLDLNEGATITRTVSDTIVFSDSKASTIGQTILRIVSDTIAFGESVKRTVNGFIQGLWSNKTRNSTTFTNKTRNSTTFVNKDKSGT